MSFIKLQSNVAGTGIVTVASLNTNTDSTITLPDQTGTLVASDPAGNVSISGSLGVGTSTPVSKLQVTNTLAITNSSGYQYLLMGNQDSSGTNKPNIIRSGNAILQFGIGDSWSSATGGTFSAFTTINASGNVGIGTTSPTSKLDILGLGSTTQPTNISDLTDGIRINSNRAGNAFTGISYQDNAGGGAAVVFNRGGSYDTTIQFYTNASSNTVIGALTERMRITSTGAVSFGATGTNYGSSGQVLTSQGNGPPTWTTVASSGGTVTSVTGTGTVNGISLSGTVTTTGSLTLSGSLSGSLSGCTVDGTNSVGYLNIPQNSQTNSYTLVASDAGKHIYHATAAPAATYTIPANSSVAYAIGTAISFVNFSNAVLSIACGDTMYLAGTGTTGTRSLAQWGTATALKVQSTGWVISGAGLT